MIYLAFLAGMILGVLVSTIYYATQDMARIEVAKYFNPEQPLKLNSVLNDLLSEAAQKQRDELSIQYAHLSHDTREITIDKEMHKMFLEMIDDLEQSVKIVKGKSIPYQRVR